MRNAGVVAARALALVDLTNLSESCSLSDIDLLCRRSVGPFGSTAAVCVWPRFVFRAVRLLSGSGVRVATVVNFPGGGEDAAATISDTKRAIVDGAHEIDLVLPYRAFLAGRTDVAAEMVHEVRRSADPSVVLKVILETGSYPSLDAIRNAARLAITKGADFVKTSTGKYPISATMSATMMMLDAIRETGRHVGIKPSGGIKTLEDAARYLALADEMMGAARATPETFRFGASGLLDALEDAIASDLPITSEDN